MCVFTVLTFCGMCQCGCDLWLCALYTCVAIDVTATVCIDREIVIHDQVIVRTPTNALEVTPLHIQQHHLKVASDVEQSTRG